MHLMKAASTSRRSFTISFTIKLMATQYPGPGPADSTTSPSSFLKLRSCQLNSAEQPTCIRGPFLHAIQFVPCRLSSCEQVRSS